MASKKRNREEIFTLRPTTTKRRTKKKNKILALWSNLTEGWFGAVVYVILGIVLALVTKQLLAVGLATDMPVVAVVSPSMQHNNADLTHYQWLATNLDYSKDYVDSWPVPRGFMVGDMPIVKGEREYKIGDVIVYSAPAQKFPIIHRIIKINEDGTYQTKGDNNTDQLPYEFKVAKGQIYGKVVLVIPKLGYFKVIITKILGDI